MREAGNWLDVEIASLREEIDQEGQSRADGPRHEVARSVRHRVESIRAWRPSGRRGAARTAWLPRIRGAVRFARIRAGSIVFYGFVVTLGVLVGWLAVFLANRY